MSNQKQKLGQFFTTNYAYILKNMVIPEVVTTIVEPFTGNGDLLNFLDKEFIVESYDIDPKLPMTIQQDTLVNPPCYDGKFILTNPPYLARNKNDDKSIYEKYGYNDLYKCFIGSIIQGNCLGGIIIVPLNFFCSIRKSDIALRKVFLSAFNIVLLNIFEERVFDDTGYTVCSISFIRNETGSNDIPTCVYPSGREFLFVLSSVNNFTIGGEIYKIPTDKNFNTERATRLTKPENISNILLKCIDDNINSKIRLEIVSDDKRYIDTTKKLSARSYATLVFKRKISLTKQKKLVLEFNNYLNKQRETYNSLFLSNYRESNTIARKRISFTLAFKICDYILSTI
jgi:hypothetical protein